MAIHMSTNRPAAVKVKLKWPAWNAGMKPRRGQTIVRSERDFRPGASSDFRFSWGGITANPLCIEGWWGVDPPPRKGIVLTQSHILYTDAWLSSKTSSKCVFMQNTFSLHFKCRVECCCAVKVYSQSSQIVTIFSQTKKIKDSVYLYQTAKSYQTCVVILKWKFCKN